MTKTISIRKIGNPVLRTKARKVSEKEIRTPEFRQFLNGMISAMRAAHGVGLAANQAGVPLRVIVAEQKKNPRYPRAENFPLRILINPRIVRYSRAVQADWEGCLSIPGYRGKVPRSRKIVFEATDENGKKLGETAEGFFARVLQHEIDHLNGILFIDRMRDMRTFCHLEESN